jgi:hypothetical protein
MMVPPIDILPKEKKLMKPSTSARVITAGLILATSFAASPSQTIASQGTQVSRGTVKKPTTAQKSAAVPAALVGSWTWGSVNPGRYVDKVTGDYVGHAGGGATSYTFGKDGSHKRYVLIDMGAGWGNETVFSAMEGTATFDEAAGVFKVRLTKGTITFKKRSGTTKRKLTQEDLDRGGTEFTYRLEKDDKGTPYLLVNDKGKPASEGRRFNKDVESTS